MIILVAAGVATYVVYSLAFHAPWFYDDGPNLRDLSDVSDFGSALGFVITGIASELGRPLSNLTFLLNAADWPTNPAGFRHTGTLFHLINGLLLAWVAYRAARMIPSLQKRPELFAVLLASTWLVHPLLFSTTLMPVQRMTVLSGTFVLMGLLLYAIGRERLQTPAWRSGLVLCTVGVVAGTGLGVLAKEQAILLPLLILIVEVTLFKPLPMTAPTAFWRTWVGIFLILPIFALTTYIFVHWPGVVGTYEMRSFDLDTRLGAQSVILWEYLRLALIPDVIRMGPFQDGAFGRSLTSPATVLAIAAWAGALLVAFALRKKTPFLLFGLLWFLGAHVLESSVWPLELYFEHRNYIPLIGPLATVIALALTSTNFRWVPWVMLVVFTVVLWRNASLWNDPLEAAEMQLIYQPNSVRAVQFAAMQYDERGDRNTAFLIVDSGAERIPAASDLHATRLQLACSYGNEDLVRDSSDRIHRQAHNMDASYALSAALRNVHLAIAEEKCPGLSQDELFLLTSALLENPRITASGLLMHHLHHLRAEILISLARRDDAVTEMRRAHAYVRNPETAMLLAALMSAQGQSKEAIGFLDQAVSDMPMRVLKRRDDWRTTARAIRSQICADVPDYCAKTGAETW